MFIRVKKIGAYEYLYLVENAREGGRHVQRVIKALGRREAVEASGLIDGLIASAARHSRRSIVLSSFYRGELPELHRVSIGPDLVFGRLWAETGCRDVLSSLLADRRFSFDVERAVYLTVLHRLMVSGSDRHASEWRNGLRVPDADGLDLDHAYKAMAWLGRVDANGRSMAEAVEEALYRHRQPLFGAVSIAFFDTTSLWFEGAGGESLGPRGHSKDYRGHLKQVVLGIVLDDGDRPIASFLMPGNTADVTLLLPVVMTRSLCPPSSSLCKHCKLVFVIDTTWATGSADRRGHPFMSQVVGADLVGRARHNLLGGEDAVVNQPSDAVARDTEHCGGFGHREPVAVLRSGTVGMDTLCTAQRADTPRGPGFPMASRYSHPVQRRGDILVRPSGRHRPYYGDRLVGRTAAMLAGVRLADTQLRVLAAAPMDRQDNLARRLVDIGNDVGDQGTQQPLARAHGDTWRVPCGLEIVGQAGEVGRYGNWLRRLHRLQPRLARLDAAKRRLPTLLELRGD